MESEPEQAPRKHREVVSNFIIDETEPNDTRVALFRRSEKVRTYRGKLAPISGSIDAQDASPLHAAIRELREETQLDADGKDLTFHLRGKPFSISDHAIGRQWTVHPFSWLLKDPAAKAQIKLDWEHSGLSWLPPQAIFSGQHEQDSVPNLEESLRRVWLGPEGMLGDEAGHHLRSCLAALQHDHESGAKVMASHALQYLGEVVGLCDGESSLSPGRDLWKQVRMIAWHLIYNGRESMNAAIATTLLRCLKTLVPHRNDKQALTDAIGRYSETRRQASQRIGDAFATYLSSYLKTHNRPLAGTDATIRILTLSSSSTILSSLQTALHTYPDLRFSIRLLESRPRCEGASLAQTLLTWTREDRTPAHAGNLHITLATDASAALLARDLDMLLLGADRISASGHVSNKTGSFPAILSARAVARQQGREDSVKVVVLSEMEKVCKPVLVGADREEENDPEEVVRAWESFGVLGFGEGKEDTGVEVKNTYFEWVPADEIDVYFSEEGVVSREQIREQALYVEQLEMELFDDI